VTPLFSIVNLGLMHECFHLLQGVVRKIINFEHK